MPEESVQYWVRWTDSKLDPVQYKPNSPTFAPSVETEFPVPLPTRFILKTESSGKKNGIVKYQISLDGVLWIHQHIAQRMHAVSLTGIK